jgi:hypothetical protein
MHPTSFPYHISQPTSLVGIGSPLAQSLAILMSASIFVCPKLKQMPQCVWLFLSEEVITAEQGPLVRKLPDNEKVDRTSSVPMRPPSPTITTRSVGVAKIQDSPGCGVKSVRKDVLCTYAHLPSPTNYDTQCRSGDDPRFPWLRSRISTKGARNQSFWHTATILCLPA